MDPVWIVLATLAVAVAGGLIPVINVEAWVFGVSAASTGATVVPVALAATVGQVAAKSLLYRAGGSAAAWGTRRAAPGLATAVRRLEGAASRGTAVVFASALIGVPPFYVVSVAAGVGRFRFERFLVLALVGRALRFGLVFLLPRLLRLP